MKLIKKILVITFSSLFNTINKLTPKNKDLIIFESYFGKQFSDNPKALYLFLKKNNPDLKLIWSVHKEAQSVFIKENIPFVKKFSLKWFVTMSRAKYWIVNTRLPHWMQASNDTIIVQTWHGTPLKKLALDMDEIHIPGTDLVNYKKEFELDAKKWDYLISPNAYSTKVFRRAFNFKNSIIETGYPRNDILYLKNNDDFIRELKAKYNIPLNKKIVLYAPTWRDNQFYTEGNYKFTPPIDLNKLVEELSSDFFIILRLHYLISEQINIEDFSYFISDLSTNVDISELFLISDILITDYSSVFFDFLNLRRPIIFFPYDLKEYQTKLRGFYLNYDEQSLPGPIAINATQLFKLIKGTDQWFKKDDYNKFYKKFCYLEDGNSSFKVLKNVLK